MAAVAQNSSRQPLYSFRLFTAPAKGFILNKSSTNLRRIRLGLVVKDISQLYRASNYNAAQLKQVGLEKPKIDSFLTSTSQKLENLIDEIKQGIMDLDKQIDLNKALVSFKSIPIDEPETYPMFTKVPTNKRLTHALTLLDQYMVRLHQLFETGCISQVERNSWRKAETSRFQSFLNEVHQACKDTVRKISELDALLREGKT